MYLRSFDFLAKNLSHLNHEVSAEFLNICTFKYKVLAMKCTLWSLFCTIYFGLDFSVCFIKAKFYN